MYTVYKIDNEIFSQESPGNFYLIFCFKILGKFILVRTFIHSLSDMTIALIRVIRRSNSTRDTNAASS